MSDQVKEDNSAVNVKIEIETPTLSDQQKENDSAASKTEEEKKEIEENLLAERGREAITKAEGLMSGLMECRRRYGLVQPLYGARIAGCSYFDAKTAVLIETLIALGAEVQWTNKDLFYSQADEDAVAAALKKAGVSVHIWDDDTKLEGWRVVQFPFGKKANLILDDDGFLIDAIAPQTDWHQPAIGVIVFLTLPAVTQSTVSAANLKIFNAHKLLAKAKLSSYYGWEGSLVKYMKDFVGKMQAPDDMCVLLGYSAKGKSCAGALRSAGVKVLITEPNSVDALEAKINGFELVTMQQACKRAKVFVIATDCLETILDYIGKMSDGSHVCNIGNSKSDMDWFKQNAKKIERPQVYLTRYRLENGNHVEHLDLECLDRVGDRCPNAVSYSYTLWLLAAIHVWSKRGDPSRGSHSLPNELEEEAARLHL